MVIAVPLRGANRPKLKKTMASQRISRTRNGKGMLLPAFSANSQRACPRLSESVSASERSQRCLSSVGASDSAQEWMAGDAQYASWRLRQSPLLTDCSRDQCHQTPITTNSMAGSISTTMTGAHGASMPQVGR